MDTLKSRLRTYLRHLEGRVSLVYIRALNSNLGHPYYSPDYIARHIDRPETDASELRAFWLTQKGARFNIRRWLTMLIAVLVSFKLGLWPATVLYEMHLQEPELNLISHHHKVVLSSSSLSSSSGGGGGGGGANNSQYINHYHHHLYTFACLATNCTSLHLNSVGATLFKSGESLARKLELRQQTAVKLAYELLELPYFSICHPWLSVAHDAMQYMNSELLILSLMSAIFVLIAGIIYPLTNIAYPTQNLTLTFHLAPEVSRRLVHDRAKCLYASLAGSLENYCANLIECERQNSRRSADFYTGEHIALELRADIAAHYIASQLNKVDSKMSSRRGRGRRRRQSDRDQSPAELLAQEQAIQQVDKWADDCVSVMRSHWWLETGSRHIAYMCYPLLGSLYVVVPLLVPVIFGLALSARRQLFAQMNERMRASGCAIWRQHDKTVLNLTQLHPSTMWFFLSSMLPYGLAIWIISFELLYVIGFYAINTELSCWLNEIKFHMQVLRDMSSLLCIGPSHWSTTMYHDDENHPLAPAPAPPPPPPLPLPINHVRLLRQSRLNQCQISTINLKGVDSYCLARTGKRFTKLTKIYFNLVQTKCFDGTNSRFSSDLAREAHVMRSIQVNLMTRDTLIDALHKLYVSFRIFREQVDSSAPAMTIMILSINTYIYVLVILCIWYIRLVGVYARLAYFLMLSNWITVTLNFIIPCKFHAQAKELHLLFYSLIANTCRANHNEIRLVHLQTLWLKHINALDCEGGLALRAHNVRLTYSRILKLIVATGTLMVFVLGL